MNEIKKIVDALAHIRAAQELLDSFQGRREFLEDVDEWLSSIKEYLADTIAVTAKNMDDF